MTGANNDLSVSASADEARVLDLPTGTYRRLHRLSDDEGRFSMLAVDQRGSLRRMIGRQTDQDPGDVEPESLRLVKRLVKEAITPLATAVLTDPLYGYPASVDVIPRDTGVLLAGEKTGYVSSGTEERRSRLLDDWGVSEILESGADAIKLLIYYHPEASEATRTHQEELVEKVGRAAVEHGLPFILEAVTYALEDVDSKGPEFAKRKPDLVARSADRFSASRFNVDVLKLEFPANLKYTAEYKDEPYGRSPSVYEKADVRAACERLDDASRVPWVILSAGVDIDEFVENVKLSNDAGASGFLCGRAVWKHIVDYFPDKDRMRGHIQGAGRQNFERLLEVNERALPWHQHRRFQD